jgi:hypothetical protein
MATTSIEAMTRPPKKGPVKGTRNRDRASVSQWAGQAVETKSDPMPPVTWDETQLRQAIEAAGVSLWSW